jgi:hypothetical protein
VGGWGESGTREKVRWATVHKAGSKYQHDWMYLQCINSDIHLPQSPFTGQFFRSRHFALVPVYMQYMNGRVILVHVKCVQCSLQLIALLRPFPVLFASSSQLCWSKKMLIALLVDSVCNNHGKEMAGNVNMQAMANSGFSCARAPLRPPVFLGSWTQNIAPPFLCNCCRWENPQKIRVCEKNAPICVPPGQSRKGLLLY